MRRTLFIIVAVIIASGPTASILFAAAMLWGRLATDYVDTTWAIVWITCSYIALVILFARVLHILKAGRRLWYSLLLCGGTTAACAAALLSIWVMWLTPWRPGLLIVNGLAIPGLFYLLYRCRCAFELRLFGWVFVVGGLALYAVAAQEVYVVAAMTTWTSTEGTITHCSQSASKANEFRTEELAYEYAVGGQRYVGTQDSWKSSRMRRGWRDHLDQIYPWHGGKVAVYYDPMQPEKAVLRPGLSYATAFLLKASSWSMLGGIALLMASVRLRARVPVCGRDGPVTTAIEKVGRTHRRAERATFGVLGVCVLMVTMCIQPISAATMRVPRIDRVPTTADGFCERGFHFLREHRPQRAFNSFTHGLCLDPNNAALYFNRGRACVQLGRIPQALDDWRKTIQLDWSAAFPVYYHYRRLAPDDSELDKIITKVTLDHLDDLEEVSGYAVGAMAETGAFYTASLILAAHLSDEDFLRMAEDQNPVVCAMALIVLARRDLARYRTTIQSFYDERIEVMYMPVGCAISAIPLGTLARNIVEDPKTLQHWDPEKTRWLWQHGR